MLLQLGSGTEHKKENKIIISKKQGENVKKYKFYYRDKAIAKQDAYLGFTFTPSGKKQVGIDNLINKARKIIRKFSIQKITHKSKEKTTDIYLEIH